MDTIVEWFLTKPQRIIDSGKALFGLGFALLIAGLWGLVATTSVSAVLNMAHSKTLQTDKTLTDIFFDLPTWWIPESFLGFTFSLLLILAGFVIALTGKKYRRLLEH